MDFKVASSTPNSVFGQPQNLHNQQRQQGLFGCASSAASSLFGQPQINLPIQQQQPLNFNPHNQQQQQRNFGSAQTASPFEAPPSAPSQSGSLSFGSIQPSAFVRNLPVFGSGQPLPQQQLNIFGATGFSVQAKSANAPSPTISTDDDKLILLISTQSFDGAFQVDFVLAQLLNTTLEEIKEGNLRLNLYLVFSPRFYPP